MFQQQLDPVFGSLLISALVAAIPIVLLFVLLGVFHVKAPFAAIAALVLSIVLAIVGRVVGVTIELLARSIGARRVFELGSGFGYSAYWFARAVGPQGEVHGTDGDPANEAKALDYLGRAGVGDRIRWHVGDALDALAGADGEFDVVF